MVKKVTCSCGQRFGNDEQHRIHALKHGPSTHQRVRGPVTFADAVAAGDGTLHGAIDHWQDRAKTAEARLAEAERLLDEASPRQECDGCGREFRWHQMFVEEGDRWECAECWDRCEKAERAAMMDRHDDK